MALTSTDLAYLTARYGLMRFGASRFGFAPAMVQGNTPGSPGGFYSWTPKGASVAAYECKDDQVPPPPRGNVDIHLTGDIPPADFLHACVGGVEYGPVAAYGFNRFLLDNVPAGPGVQFTAWVAFDDAYVQFSRDVIADVTTFYDVGLSYPAGWTFAPHPACP